MADDSIISGRIDVDTTSANSKLDGFQKNLDKTYEKYKDVVSRIKAATLDLPGEKGKGLDLNIQGLNNVQLYLNKIKELNNSAPSVTRFTNTVKKLSDVSAALKADNIQKFGDLLASFATDIVVFNSTVNTASQALIAFNSAVKETRMNTIMAADGVKKLAAATASFNLIKNGRLDFKFDPKAMDDATKQMGSFVGKIVRQVEIAENAIAAVGKELDRGAFRKLSSESKAAQTVLDKVSSGIRLASTDTRNFAIDIRAVNTILGVIGYSAFANQIKSIASAMVDATAKTQEYKSSLLAITKSQTVANDLFKQFQDYSIKTPFELPDVMESGIKLEAVTKKLKGFTMSTKEALELAGDLSMTFGKDLRTGVDTIAKALGGSAESVEMLRNNFGVTRPDLERFGVAVSRQGGVMLRTEAEIHNYIRAIKEIQKEVSGLQALDFREGNLATAIAAIHDNLIKLYNELGSSVMPILKAFANGMSYLFNVLQQLPTGFKQILAIAILTSAGVFIFAEKLAGLAIILTTIIGLTEKKAAADLAAAEAAVAHAAAEKAKTAALTGALGGSVGRQIFTTAGWAAQPGVPQTASTGVVSPGGWSSSRSIVTETAAGAAGGAAGSAARIGMAQLFPTFSAWLGGLFGGLATGIGGLFTKILGVLATPFSALGATLGTFGAVVSTLTGVMGTLAVIGAVYAGVLALSTGNLGIKGNEGAKDYYKFREQDENYTKGVHGMGGGGLLKSAEDVSEGNIAITGANRNESKFNRDALSRRYQRLLRQEAVLAKYEDGGVFGGGLSETNKAHLKEIRGALETTKQNLNVVTGRGKLDGATLTELNYREQLKEVDRTLDIAKLGGKDETSELAKQIPILQKIVKETANDNDLVEVNLEARKQLIQRLNEQVQIMQLHVSLAIQAQQSGQYYLSVQDKASLLQQEIAAMTGQSERDSIERAKKELELRNLTTLELQKQNNEFSKLAREGVRAQQEFVSIEDRLKDKYTEIEDKKKLKGYERSPEYQADINQMIQMQTEQKVVRRERLMKEYEYTKTEWAFKINQANLASIEMGKLITDQHLREKLLLLEKQRIYREYYKFLLDSAREYAQAVTGRNDQALSNRSGEIDIREKYGYHEEKARIKLAEDTYKNAVDKIKLDSGGKISGYEKELNDPKTDKNRLEDVKRLIELEKEAMALRLRGAEIDKDKLLQENTLKEHQRERDERKDALELARDRIKYKQTVILDEIKNGKGNNGDLTYSVQDTMRDAYKAESELLDLRKQTALETLKGNDLERELLKIKFEQFKLGQDQLKTWMDINAEIRKQKQEKENERKKAFYKGGDATTGGIYSSYEDMMKADADKEKARLEAKDKQRADEDEAAARLRDQFIGERLFGIKKVGPRDKILDQETGLTNALPGIDNTKTLKGQEFTQFINGCFGVMGSQIIKEGPGTADDIMRKAKKTNEELKPVEATVDVVIHLEGKEIKREKLNLHGTQKKIQTPKGRNFGPGGL